MLHVDIAPDDFHARYSAKGKTYSYRVVCGPVMSPFWFRYAIQESRRLDLDRIQRCAREFLGEHDWTAFSAAQSEVESRVRTITQLDIQRRLDLGRRSQLIEFTVSANGFLRYMVRSIAGTLMAVGRGEIDQRTVERAIKECDRSLVGPTAPAHGLTLVSVEY